MLIPAKKNTIGAIGKHVVLHHVAVILTIIAILLDVFISAFWGERDAVHETDDIVYERFSLVDHVCELPHLGGVRELYPSNRMRP